MFRPEFLEFGGKGLMEERIVPIDNLGISNFFDRSAIRPKRETGFYILGFCDSISIRGTWVALERKRINV
jgi:hypothetical protein